MSSLNKKTFTSFDDDGCQFIGEVYTVRNYKGGPIVEQDYYSMSVHAKTLAELKTKVSNLKSR